METCAKICTAFLDSSFGLAIAMGVVGIVTTSLCAGEDMIDVVATTLFPSVTTAASPTISPISNKELVYLCTPGYQELLGKDKIADQNWTLGQFGIGRFDGRSSSRYDMYCFSVQEYHNQYPNTSFPECSATDWARYPNYNASDSYLTYVHVHKAAKGLGLELNAMKDCMMKGVFDMLGASDPSLLGKAFDAKYKPESIYNDTGHDRTDADDGVDRGAYCWESDKNMKSQFPSYFPDTTNCTLSKGDPLAPSTTSVPLTTVIDILTTSVASMKVATEMPGVDSSCPPCSAMMLVFGAGSAFVLTTTLAKIVYAQCKKLKRANTTASRNRCDKMVMRSVKEWLLLGASGLGTGVLVISAKDFCGSPSKDTTKMVVISTALYLTSAAARLLGTCITSPIEEDEDHEEDVEVGLPMIASLGAWDSSFGYRQWE
ncbi:hypothetical protein CLAVI_000940 [Candidatus Clavichlamydia salmonicola]|uniref:hypothetical protein n=1 Tax=Candidatus Clavichlamydia salmonicola TaxID=469812 RepID=UPI001891D28B|nr:hypothetical protein [Candidatus Clavichlamydia salmonicola]MBF5051299.1 hypothetical protein [Candidatus Clavichlamydia salmonicola]